MTAYIQKILHSIDDLAISTVSSLPLFNQSEIQSSEGLELFKKEVNEKLKLIMDQFNTSVILGEYIQSSDFPEGLNKISEKINGFPIPTPVNPEVQEAVQNNLQQYFIKGISECVGAYLWFYFQVHDQIEPTNSITMDTYIHKQRKSFDSEPWDFDTYRSLDFFYNNLEIARLDHFLKSDREHFDQVQRLYHFFLVDSHKFSILLSKKANFLMLKWALRQKYIKKTEESGEPATVYIIHNGNREELESLGEDNFIYNHWRKILDSQYEFSNEWKSVVSNEVRNSRIKEFPDLSGLEIYRQIKYYKDVTRDLTALQLIKRELKQRYDNVYKLDTYQLFLTGMQLSYAVNNELSLQLDICENKEFHMESLQKVQLLYDEIVDIQKRTRIFNFFPQFKYLQFLSRIIDGDFASSNVMKRSIALRERLNICLKVITDYKSNIKWSEDHYNYVYNLSFLESLVDTGNDEIPQIYVYSSFFLPLSRERYKYELADIIRKIDNYESSIRVLESLTPEIESVQRKDFKQIEIIGIFTAIVTFIAASVQGFAFIADARAATVFTLAIGTSLGVFVFFMLLLFRGISEVKKHWISLVLIFVATASLWAYLFSYPDKWELPKNEKTNTTYSTLLGVS